MASVLIVDDQPLIHVGLQQVLSQEYRGLVFGEARNSDEAAVRLGRQPWDLKRARHYHFAPSQQSVMKRCMML